MIFAAFDPAGLLCSLIVIGVLLIVGLKVWRKLCEEWRK